MTVSISNFLIQLLLTTVHFSHYVQLRFRTFRIAIIPSSNNCNNITTEPTSYTWVKWNWFLTHITSSLHKSNVCCLYVNVSYFFYLVLRCVNSGRIYSLVTKDLKLDWLIQVTWKRRALVNYIRVRIFACIAAQKLTNVPAVIFPYPCRSRWFIFMKQIIVLFESFFTV